MDENNNVDIMSASEGDAGVVPPAERDIRARTTDDRQGVPLKKGLVLDVSPFHGSDHLCPVGGNKQSFG